MAGPSEGDRAPAFTLVDQDGERVKLTDQRGKRVVVYFYPKRWSRKVSTARSITGNLRPGFESLG